MGLRAPGALCQGCCVPRHRPHQHQLGVPVGAPALGGAWTRVVACCSATRASGCRLVLVLIRWAIRVAAPRRAPAGRAATRPRAGHQTLTARLLANVMGEDDCPARRQIHGQRDPPGTRAALLNGRLLGMPRRLGHLGAGPPGATPRRPGHEGQVSTCRTGWRCPSRWPGRTVCCCWNGPARHRSGARPAPSPAQHWRSPCHADEPAACVVDPTASACCWLAHRLATGSSRSRRASRHGADVCGLADVQRHAHHPPPCR